VNPVGLAVLALAVVGATAFGVWRLRNDGRLKSTDQPGHLDALGTSEQLTATDLGTSLGGKATLVQFSTVFCAPCRATRRVLGEVSEMVDGVTFVDVDAEDHLDLVRRLDVRRTPTVLILDADGRIAQRATGQPRKPDVIAALGALIP
jgi:thiol-disulfide isomerase/thioredoxin